MKENSIVTRLFIGLMLLAIAIISITSISSTTTQLHIKIIWNATIIASCITIVLLLLKKRTPAIIGLLAVLGLILVAITIQSRVIPYCGDRVCTNSECASGCDDCTPDLCKNRRCDVPLENCENSNDCRCPYKLACDVQRNGSDEKGCNEISCGDGFCDDSENTNNCCDDCGCQIEHICRQHACYFIPPHITLNTRVATARISVTTIAADPKLSTENNTPQPYAGMMLESLSRLHDLKLDFSIGGLVNDTMELGDIMPNTQVPVLWYLPHNEQTTNALLFTNDSRVNFTIKARFNDILGDEHSQKWNFPITLLGRNSLDSNRHIVLYITKDYVPKGSTPEQIWYELQGQVSADQKNDDKILFPQETLAAGHGDRNDLAVLIASAYDAKNLSPSLILANDGFYIRVRTDAKSGGRFVTLDPASISQPFDKAIIQPPGSALYEITQERIDRNYTIISLNDSYIPGRMIETRTSLDTLCPCSGYCWTRAVATHTIKNNGLVKSSICATSKITPVNAINITDEKKQCFVLDPSESLNFNHGWKNNDGCTNVTAELMID